jgi:hypothetical protein
MNHIIQPNFGTLFVEHPVYSRMILAVEDVVRFQGSPCGILREYRGIGTTLSLSCLWRRGTGCNFRRRGLMLCQELHQVDDDRYSTRRLVVGQFDSLR